MGKWLLAVGMLAASVLSSVPGCRTHACTEIGCQDGFRATVKRADGSFPSGNHRVEILADGVTTTCTFTFPLPTTAGGVTQSPQCPLGITVNVGTAEICKEIHTTTSSSLQCEPVPGQFVETIVISGAPAQVHAWQYVDDVPILDAAAAPTYREVFPNGTDCPPACRLAEWSWTLDDPVSPS